VFGAVWKGELGLHVPAMTDRADAADETLVAEARAGDHASFGLLMGRYQARVYRLARRLSGDRGDAEEIVQETFLRVYRKLGTFRSESRFSTWLYRVATNTALMQMRSRRRRPAESLEAWLPSFDGTGRHARVDVDFSRASRVDEIVERRQLASAALEAIARLPEAYRSVFVLRDLEELSTAQTAEVLDLGVDAVRQRLHRARLMLRGFLGHLAGEA
jgi:RNA polymerase sigma-70 factor (ECF subfamily)